MVCIRFEMKNAYKILTNSFCQFCASKNIWLVHYLVVVVVVVTVVVVATVVAVVIITICDSESTIAYIRGMRLVVIKAL